MHDLKASAVVLGSTRPERHFVIGVDLRAGIESALRRCCLVTSPRLTLVLCAN